MKPVLLYYDVLRYRPSTLATLDEHFQLVRIPDPRHDTDELLAEVEVATAPRGHAFDRRKIDRCPRLRVIASSTVSVPHVDVTYAELRGVRVCSLEGEREIVASITATAELAWGLLIALSRRIPWAHHAAVEGRWGGRPWGRRTPRMLSAMSLGIVGLGRLGRLVAEYGAAFGMRVRYYSPRSVDPVYERCSTLVDLARSVDVVSLHAKHTGETEGMIGREFLWAMRPGALLVNTARGELVDEGALLEALESGHLGGAALDVLAGEYEPDFQARLAEHPLVRYARTHDNLILTPHYAGATVDAWRRAEGRTVDLILRSMGAS